MVCLDIVTCVVDLSCQWLTLGRGHVGLGEIQALFSYLKALQERLISNLKLLEDIGSGSALTSQSAASWKTYSKPNVKTFLI